MDFILSRGNSTNEQSPSVSLAPNLLSWVLIKSLSPQLRSQLFAFKVAPLCMVTVPLIVGVAGCRAGYAIVVVLLCGAVLLEPLAQAAPPVLRGLLVVAWSIVSVEAVTGFRIHDDL